MFEAESASTAESGDSVVLKTTASAYVEIDRNSFSEVMREELGRLIKGNADKWTSIDSIAAMDSSNDLGCISLANLASVLGVPTKEKLIELVANPPNQPETYVDTFQLCNSQFKISIAPLSGNLYVHTAYVSWKKIGQWKFYWA